MTVHLSKWSISIPVLWAVCIAVMSLIPPSDIPVKSFPFQDKIGHLVVYALLAWLTMWSFSRAALRVKPAILVLSIMVYGLIMEILQYKFFPYRSFEILDIVANIIGSFGGYLIFKYLKR